MASGTQLDPLVMMIDPEKDSTVLTPEGIVLDIPQHAFVDSTGHAITSPVRVTFLEALNGADIMKAGLSTMSGDTLLETGGMFYIDAQANGKKVGIDPSKPLTAMVPAQEAKPGMMLYKGAMKADGVIDWRDPQPLKRSLVPVDITTLNFYPPGYEKKLAELGRDVTNKTFKDSLYYSFMCSAPTDTSITKEYLLALPPDEPEILPMAFAGLGAAFEFSYPSEQVQTDTLVTGTWGKNCGIDPSKVMTIWNARFDKTNIATRAFEERMAAIHGTCANAVLDLYVNNLDKDLSDIDAQVGRSGYPVFDHFASTKNICKAVTKTELK